MEQIPTPEPDDLIKQAEQAIPEAWHENRRNVLVAWGVGYVAGLAEYRYGPDLPFIVKAVASETLYIGAAAADRITTLKLMRTNLALRAAGIHPPYSESNVLIPGMTDPEAFKKSKRAWAGDIGCGLVAALGLSFGMPLAAARGTASLNNARKNKRMHHVLKLAAPKES